MKIGFQIDENPELLEVLDRTFSEFLVTPLATNRRPEKVGDF